MKRGISSNTRHELIGALSERYRQGSRSEKGKILDELVKLTKSHRKHACLLQGLNPHCCKENSPGPRWGILAIAA